VRGERLAVALGLGIEEAAERVRPAGDDQIVEVSGGANVKRNRTTLMA